MAGRIILERAEHGIALPLVEAPRLEAEGVEPDGVAAAPPRLGQEEELGEEPTESRSASQPADRLSLLAHQHCERAAASGARLGLVEGDESGKDGLVTRRTGGVGDDDLR